MYDIQQDKERLNHILNGEEFQRYYQQKENLLYQILLSIWEWIVQWFPAIHFNPDSARMASIITILSYFIIVLSILGLVAVLYWFSKQIMKQKRLQYKLQVSDQELLLSYTDYILKAKQAKDMNQSREAVRYWFLALLLFCEKQELLKIEKWKTNYLYMQEIKEKNSSYALLFQSWAHVFEQTWYGKQEIIEEDYERYVQQLEEHMRGDRHAAS